MNMLDVYFHGQKVGVLKENNSRISFKYLDGVVTPIAHLLPIKSGWFEDKETRAFFSNLLPEGDVAKKIAQLKQISINNPFGFLMELGGECAGAISLYPQDMRPQFHAGLNEISEAEIASILKILPEKPLLTEESIRLSLAGAQEKLALTSLPGDKRYFLPNDEYISTWIIKPQGNNFKNLVYNEFFCMTLARSIGLETAICTVKKFEDVEAYMVQRFDRKEIEGKGLVRLHQEDFCQGLGVSNKKYQKEGGPSVKQCFNFIHNNFLTKGLNELNFINTIIFNFLIGNSDAHGKNFSFLHISNPPGYIMSPLYDLVSTQVYLKLAKNMAMAIGGEYDPDKINQSHFVKMALDLEIKPKFVQNQIKKISELTITYAKGLKEPLALKGISSPIFDDIIGIIEKRAKQVNDENISKKL